ncbi:hypothetical protein GLU64_02645 [Nanohaloarchaea archaeon]|nr:hypothetical protein [Candidatus Nanohaloarchaea archaeon]
MPKEPEFMYVANPKDGSTYAFQKSFEFSGPPLQPLNREGKYVGRIDDVDSGMDDNLYVDADVLRAYIPEGYVAEIPRDIHVDVAPNSNSNDGITTSLEVTEELSGDDRYLVMGVPDNGMDQSVNPIYHSRVNKFFDEGVTISRKSDTMPLINKVEDIHTFLNRGAS